MNQSPLHVFVVHSPLALVMMALVIKHDRIVQSDARAILVRNQHRAQTFLRRRGIKSFHSSDILLRAGYIPPRAGLRLIAHFDRCIKRTTEARSYHLYTFDLVSSLNQLAITHSSCLSVSILEEGKGHMRPFTVQEKNQFLRAENQPLYSNSHRDRFFSTGMVSSRASKLYSFSKFAWPGMDSINVFDIETLRGFSLETNIDLLLLLPAYKNLSDGTRLKELGPLETLQTDRNFRLTVKYHPANTRKEKRFWGAHLKERFGQFETIQSDTFSVEAALASQRVSLIAGWGSSALVYGRMFGINCIDLNSY